MPPRQRAAKSPTRAARPPASPAPRVKGAAAAPAGVSWNAQQTPLGVALNNYLAPLLTMLVTPYLAYVVTYITSLPTPTIGAFLERCAARGVYGIHADILAELSPTTEAAQHGHSATLAGPQLAPCSSPGGQGRSTPPAPPQGAPGSSGRCAHWEQPAHWAPRHCLGCSSQPPPKPPISPPVTTQAANPSPSPDPHPDQAATLLLVFNFVALLIYWWPGPTEHGPVTITPNPNPNPSPRAGDHPRPHARILVRVGLG